jgi:hypothetical protein
MPDVLVVKETPRGFGATLLGLTGIIAWELHSNWDELSWFLRVFFAGFISLLWLVYFQVAFKVTARFDRRADRIDIARHGLFSASKETYRFQDFHRTRVEESNDSDGPTFRLVLVFSNATHAESDPVSRELLKNERLRDSRGLAPNEVPFTAYLSSGSGRPRKAAAAINDWTRVTRA